MARLTRNHAQRQSAPKAEPALSDVAELVGCEEDPIGESAAALESLNLGHAGLRNECWSGTRGMVSDMLRSGSAGTRLATQRARGPRRTHTQLHHSRPPHSAEARFTPDNRENLTF